ncbi:MAG: 2-oxo-4-hydroxy-4-carboxy-5-ureidoimidazoline decarboxylase [Candidatus Eremiobacteraeota bacterium]|nr:2-oxo-4-hydroxy-4-carboxy-5-ureidoimidazoline decarboxylase [Candidatus Eremiobacteraeota bacterium]
MTLDALNRSDRAAFLAAVGFAFEDSPWIAEAAWERRPFGSVAALHASMLNVLREAPLERRIALIAAHPDLAGRVAREGRLTPSSHEEQSAAGLDRLTPEEMSRFDALNAAYRRHFGFPFVICARQHDKTSILAALERRLAHERTVEVETALAEIAEIARLRLQGALTA